MMGDRGLCLAIELVLGGIGGGIAETHDN